eukprot:SAG31_NODE_18792_length_622_cov_1.370937_1_plen_134_part_00
MNSCIQLLELELELESLDDDDPLPLDELLELELEPEPELELELLELLELLLDDAARFRFFDFFAAASACCFSCASRARTSSYSIIQDQRMRNDITSLDFGPVYLRQYLRRQLGIFQHLSPRRSAESCGVSHET